VSEKDNGFTHRDGVSLREYFESKFDALEKASRLAEDKLNARLEIMNEFRSAMKDQAGQFITRTECHGRKAHVDKEIQDFREFKAVVESKASSVYVTVVMVISLLALLLGILDFLIKVYK
jgi:hypothetical protein